MNLYRIPYPRTLERWKYLESRLETLRLSLGSQAVIRDRRREKLNPVAIPKHERRQRNEAKRRRRSARAS